MRFIKKILLTTILVACICMAAYMTYLQFNYYFNNDDVASISYRHFNEEEKDEYPTITLCLSDMKENGKIFNQTHAVFNTNSVTPLLYEKFLKGNQRIKFEKLNFDFSTIQYNDVVLNIHDGYLQRSVSGTSFEMFKHHIEIFPFSLNAAFYRIPHIFCFEKNVSYQKNVRQYWDAIDLNGTLLYDQGLTLSVYVHQKGKLMRAAMQNSELISPHDYKHGFFRYYDINDIEVLRRRSDSNIPCDEELIDEDGLFLKKIMTDAKCVPTFWEPFFNNTTWTTNFPKCKNSRQYRKIYLAFLSRLSKIGKDYVQPCTKMKVSVVTRDRNSQPGQLKLYFLYNQDVYKEIVNTRAFTVETLLGQIGGFVGI